MNSRIAATSKLNDISCLIATGLGRLHLVQAAEHLSKIGVNVELVQGWVPRRTPDRVVDFLGRCVGSAYLAAGMKKRQASFLGPGKSHSCAGPELLAQGLLALSRSGLINPRAASAFAWDVFGRCSRKHIKNQHVFHVRSGAGGGGAIEMARSRGLKIVVDHSIAHPAFMESALSAEYRRAGLPFFMGPRDPFWKVVLEDCWAADMLLVNSSFVKQTFVDEGYPADRIAIAYLGVREDFIGLKSQYARGERIEILFTGGFGYRKGAQYIIPALQSLVSKGIDLRFNVVGHIGEGKELLVKSGLGDRVNAVGFIPQDQLKSYLREADIYVFPSLSEGCASSAMEAMAAGLPVITTRESGLPIVHGQDGWIIPSKSPVALAEAIQYLSSDTVMRTNLGTAAKAKIESDFQWSSYAHQVRSIYLQLVGAK